MIELMKFDMGGSACTLGAAKVHSISDSVVMLFRLSLKTRLFPPVLSQSFVFLFCDFNLVANPPQLLLVLLTAVSLSASRCQRFLLI